MNRRHLAFSLMIAAASGCIHHPSVVTDGDQFSISSWRYPILNDRADTLLVPRAPLTICPSSESQGFLPVEIGWPSPRIPRIDLPLDSRFQGQDLSQMPAYIRQSSRTGESWVHLLGSWHSPYSHHPTGALAPPDTNGSISLYSDSMPGFPLQVVGRKFKQSDPEQCLIGGDALPGRLAIATIYFTQPQIMIVAFWQVDANTWIKGVGLARTSQDSAAIRSAMTNLRLAQ